MVSVVMKRLKVRAAGVGFASLMLGFLLGACGNVWAHGGEDHGDEKTITNSGEKGMVTRSARIGDLELLIKHPTLELEMPTQGQLFVTNFATNEPAADTSVMVDIETSGGGVANLGVEPGPKPGTYAIGLPALPAGTYVLRAKVSRNGETYTATFPEVKVEGKPVQGGITASSAIGNAVVYVVFGFVLALLVVLGFLLWNFAGNSSARNDEAVSIRR